MKTIILLALAACLVSCSCTAPQAFEPGTPNPLDEPGHVEPTAEELHAENLKIIRGLAR